MKKFLFGAAAAALCVSGLMAAPAAHAAVYVSQLEYKDNNGVSSLSATPFGTVTITELTPDSLKVEVDLTNAASEFVNTGGPHNPFVFSTLYADQVTTPHAAATDDPNAITTDPSNPKFFDDGRGSFTNSVFGTFTNEIALNSGNGQAGGQQDPLIFTVFDPHGITFAGIGATVDPSTGKLLTLGTGDHFTSNALGNWFSADIYDGATGQTYNVAARDAFTEIQNAVPEPATWGLMILGFGGVGAVLRRRRAAVALA
ncbi:PEPxxWA-CTERM sorting domain-containing protein [Phenylobacterium sp.]|jgi:hypothetical protein|uniref:PEPxxWA-CTERM sorting domain-containing protein n=1 Tax=Phenylobacterium sp. TaxID=1871053 RepID=UPI002E32F520|nr:PEPxxWA-CTERM sorting domain-containing protein [Phenylobacterium sp.]HEX3366616.1 PEPxxWA-CTERM sorting domain-containing protein [Phenylobacterium sp.]